MAEQSSGNFHDKLNADALIDVLHEAQNTVRSYDTKAQIVGVGYIFALGVVQQSGSHMPVPIEFAGWYVLSGWLIVILPIIMFAMVLYPSRIDKVTVNHSAEKISGLMYFDVQKFPQADDYAKATINADWAAEVVYEIIKVSGIRDIKRSHFLRALYWAGGSFTMLFVSQMLRANGVMQ